MKIYEFDGGANPKRLRAFLTEKGLLTKVEFETVSIEDHANRRGSFTEKNSRGTLPVLELDNGTVIAESMAICRYLESVQPEPPLFGTDPEDEAIVEMWNRRIELGLFRFTDDVVRNTNDFFEDIIIQNEAVAEVGRKTAEKECEWLDRELADRSFVAGERFTVADITLLACFYLGQPSIWKVEGNYPNMARWFEDVSRRESAKVFE